MTTVAYIANQFPSPLEPYVMDEIEELRARGVRVVCCSGKRAQAGSFQGVRERAFGGETLNLQPLTDAQVVRAVRRLGRAPEACMELLKPVLRELPRIPGRRVRTLGHTVLGAALAEELEQDGVEHIHAHHGYFASWVALVAARLLGIGFSFTLHGSDLLLRADLLAAKLRACRYCVTVSDYNREYILAKYTDVAPSKIVVQRLGVDRVRPATDAFHKPEPRRYCLLAVGRLHRVKDHEFLIRACAALRDASLPFLCWIAGDGEERAALQRQIEDLRLRDRVLLVGHIGRDDLQGYYRHADLVVLTSRSEGLPVVLMEAMAHGKLVLAPRITAIPELVEHGRTGFLYRPGALEDFVESVQWIAAHEDSLLDVGRAAAGHIAVHYDRRRNLQQFADRFLERLAQPESAYASALLQQIQLSV